MTTPTRSRLAHLISLLASWLVVAVPTAAISFTTSEDHTTLAGHDVTVTPAFDGYATLDLGPYLPGLRHPAPGRLGAHVDVGRTTLTSYSALLDRYTVIGANPDAEAAKVVGALRSIAWDSAATGAVAGLLGPVVWILLGARRRAELLRSRRKLLVVATVVALSATTLAATRPWDRAARPLDREPRWVPVEEALTSVQIPQQARALQVEAGLFTRGTERLATSLLDSYDRGLAFYSDAVQAVADIEPQLRDPAEDETVALLVSDRHLNVGMDRVARAIADAAGASVLLDAGDDTSTGSEWEAFSLDSLASTFEDYEVRYAVTGNHDHGEFVGDYLGDLGFERFDDGEAAGGPDGMRVLGADDPRSSGLGTWRDETGLSFDEHAARVADQLCTYDESGDRVSTLLVHDVNSGRPALERGCVDLVVGGHLHEQVGPEPVVGEDGRIGWAYTNGTTGGAAYAIAVGSKIRRNAQVTLVTYREGRPVGLQPVTLRTVGDFRVGDYVPLGPQAD